jgi:hypothetical protein
LTAVAVLAAVAGCGESSSPKKPRGAARPSTGPSLTAAEHAAAGRSVGRIRAYCRGVAAYLAGEGRRPPLGGALGGARKIVAIANAKPEATYRGSQRIRDLAGDLAEDLEGTNCSTRLVGELSRGLGP